MNINVSREQSIHNYDLLLSTFGKQIYLEITRPSVNRQLKISNQAVFLNNQLKRVIDKKYRQIMKSGLGNIKNPTNDLLYYIGVDITNTTIDEYDLMDTFFGELALQMKIDNKTKEVVDTQPIRKENSLWNINEKTNIISGIIYFKMDLSVKDKKVNIVLKGDIINNPQALNTLTEKELSFLKKTIFSNG